MRNLSAGNKMNFAVFTFIVAIILIILVCAIVLVLKYEKEEYQVTSAAFIYDNDYNYIDLENAAVISKKWTGNYYLKEEITDKEHKLGKYAISYDTNRTSLDLFGDFYQVLKGGDIKKISKYNTINASTEDKFYKIDDRKYLIIARNIKNDTGSLSTNNYLLIIIDRLGNALLLNNEINAKTINEMIISTDDFSFDVANEKLTFDKEQIDLKKIIGSTNEYKPVEENKVDENLIEEDKEKENQVVVGSSSTTTNTTTNTNNSSSTTIIQNGSTINAGNVNNNNNSGNNSNNSNNGNIKDDNTWVDSLNNWIGNVSNAFESIYNSGTESTDELDDSSNKSITINSLTAGTTHIDIDYTINDPDRRINVVYATITDGASIDYISLDRDTHTYRFTNLIPNTNYTVQVGYKIVYADASTKDTIEDVMTARTTIPTESLKITKVSLDKIYYTLKIDSSFIYDQGAQIKFYMNENEYDQGEEIEGTVTLKKPDLETAASVGYTGSIDIPENYSNVVVKLENTFYNKKEVETNLKAKIINY